MKGDGLEMSLGERNWTYNWSYRKDDKQVYKDIQICNAESPTLVSYNLSYFQQDNDPKHTAKVEKQYLGGSWWLSNVLELSPQLPEINLIENLRVSLDKSIRKNVLE